jgi:hypothetical protein
MGLVNGFKIKFVLFGVVFISFADVSLVVAGFQPLGIKLTAQSLGLGSSDINRHGTVDPDMPGLYTSPAAGQGSVLTIQTDGLAGRGTAANPLLVTVTARTRLDTAFDLPPWPHDYHAGILFISDEEDNLPDGRKEGLGVRAFKVNQLTGLREPGDSTRAVIEGSRHVSGGTGPDTYNWDKPNGPPHVDEAVYFDFDPFFNISAQSVEVLLSEFSMTDVIDLHIELKSGLVIDFAFLQTTSADIFEQIGTDNDKLWKLKFSGINEFQPGDVVRRFEIHAIDNCPLEPCDTAEHFWITGMIVDAAQVPGPATVMLLGLGGLLLKNRRVRH